MKIDALDNAKEELKRADHLFYVSLKYTRTVDVIKSIVERLINATMYALEAILHHLKDEGQIDDVSKLPVKRAKVVREMFANDEFIQETIKLFLFLRKVDKAPFTRTQEFRRHVTMTATIDDVAFKIKIDDIKLYFEQVKKFVFYMETLIEGEEED
jgi:hypothetical protein